MLSTDKPVYQPGQLIWMRSLALRRPDLKPVAGHEVTFTVSDPKGNVILKRRDVTSRYGIASAECPLASAILEGLYGVQCKVGDAESKLTVEVKRYVLPKFKVEVELDRPFYQPGQKLRATIRANYFFGKPVDAGAIHATLESGDVEPATVTTQEDRTNESGTAILEFALPETLPGREQDSGDARIVLRVKVTDSARQEQSATVSRIVTARPLRVEVIPEAGSLVQGLANTLYLLARYADGRPAKARLAVSGRADEIVTSELGTASMEVTPASEQVTLNIRAVDDVGLVGHEQVSLRCGRVTHDFLVRTDKAVYQGGETVHLVALGGGKEPIFVDWIKDGQTLLSQTVLKTGGRGEHQFDLPPELSGTVELWAYRFDATGMAVRKGRTLYIRPAQQLRIETAFDQAEYRPGERAKLTLRLANEQGDAAPGACAPLVRVRRVRLPSLSYS